MWRLGSVASVLILSAGSVVLVAQQPGVPARPGSETNPFRMSAAVVTGMKLTRPVAVYPLEARAKHLSGTVVLDVVVGPDGVVHKATVISGPLELTDAAFMAALKTTYRPFMNAGAPAWFHSPVSFILNATP